MCLIAVKQSEDETLYHDSFRAAAVRNGHGTGIMYPKDGRIIAKKFGTVNYKVNGELYEEFLAQPVAAIHVRIATGGSKIDDTNAHPFQILSKEEDGVDLYMMHNGIIGAVEIVDSDKSDTWHFSNLYLRQLLYRNPYGLTNPFLQQMIKKYIGSSRLVFMYGDGTTVIIDGDNSGVTSKEHGGVWLSNNHSIDIPYHTRRHYGGNNSNQIWDQELRRYVDRPKQLAHDTADETQDFVPHRDRGGNMSGSSAMRLSDGYGGDWYDENIDPLFGDEGERISAYNGQTPNWLEQQLKEEQMKKDKKDTTYSIIDKNGKIIKTAEPVKETFKREEVHINHKDKFDLCSTLDDLLLEISNLTEREIHVMAKETCDKAADILIQVKTMYENGDWFEVISRHNSK